MMVNRYLLFERDLYYPEGGWSDFRKAFETLKDAKEYAIQHKEDADVWEIVDVGLLEVIDRLNKYSTVLTK